MYESREHLPHVVEQAERRERHFQEEDLSSPWSYHVKLGRGTIWLNAIEYRILSFLAARPYRAFTRLRIAEAVSTESQPVTADTLRGHILSLRGKLGFFADYIQTVPYIGYRFRA